MIQLPSRLKAFLRHPLFLAIFITVLSLQVYRSSVLLSRVDLVGRDLLFQLRHFLKKPLPESNQLILVTIDDPTIRELKAKWPFPRSVYAEAIYKLRTLEPRVIGFDFVFQGADETEPANDQALVEALSKTDNVILASYFDHEGRLISALSSFEAAAFRTAPVNKLVDRDGIVRRAPILLKEVHTDKNHLSWETEIFLKAKGIINPTITETSERLVLRTQDKEVRIPVLRDTLDINYMATSKDISAIPFWKVLNGDVNPALFKDKIVLAGLTALSLHDFHPTPLQTLAGLTINANVILTLLSGNFLVRVPLFWTWVLLFLSLWLILRLTERYSSFISFVTVLVTGVIYIAFDFLMLWCNVIWDLSYVALVCLITFFFALLYKQFQTAVENIRLREESVRDPLTGFYTRRFLEVHLKLDMKKVLAGSRGFGAIDEVSVVMIDLDNFKLVNDSFGHQEGDRVLKRLGESIRASVRKDELVCRYGGDEFCVILPGTPLQDAIQFSEKLRLLIVGDPELSYTTEAGVKSFRVTGSFGVASVRGARVITPENLLKAADRALYRAKTGGRNQVCAYDPERDVIEGK